MTSPAKTTATAPVNEIGYQQAVGQYMWWLYENETTPELIWPQSVYVYDQMRRTDAQVGSVLRAVTLPVLRTPWRVDPAGARDEVVELIADDLGLPIVGKDPVPPARKRDRFSWQEHLSEALLMLPIGYSYFEQVYRIDPDGNRAHLRKLALRPARTIEYVNVASDGGLVSIKQYWIRSGERPQPIPVERLVAYIHAKEGGNWLGTSILRNCYKNWLLKDRLLRVQAQTIERNGMGIPLYKGQEGAPDLTTGLAMAKAWRAGDAAGTAIPFGADLVLRGVEGTLPDAEPAIRYHDEQIARAVLAHFLNLGTQTGSWALGTTFADFFTLSLQTLAQQIADVATSHVVEDLVDINFGEDEPSPRIVFDEIGSRQAATAQALKLLIDTGVIHPDDILEQSTRQQYGLPPRDPNAPPPGPLPGLVRETLRGTATGDGVAPAPAGTGSPVKAAGEPDPKDGAFDEPDDDDWDLWIDVLAEALSTFSGEVAASFDEAKHLRNPAGGKGGGRFRSMFDRITDQLTQWSKGQGPDKPLAGFDREQLRRVAVKRGVKLRRGASHQEISDALLADMRVDVTSQPKKADTNAGQRVRFTLKGADHRNTDVGVYTEANGKVSLWEVSDNGERHRRIALADDLAGLEAWANQHGESELAGWARTEQGGVPAVPVKAPVKRVPRKAATKKVAPTADLTGAGGLSSDPAVRQVQLENRVRDSYARLQTQPGDWVPLTKLRDDLAGMDRSDVDAALEALAMQPGIQLIPWDNRKALSTRDHEAALRFGGDNNHALRIEQDSLSLRPLPAPAAPAKTATKRAPAKALAAPTTPDATLADLRALGSHDEAWAAASKLTVPQLKALMQHMGYGQGLAGQRKGALVDRLVGTWPEMRVDTKPAAPAQPTPPVLGYADRQAALLAPEGQPIVRRLEGGVAAQTDLLTYPDGSRVVRKTYRPDPVSGKVSADSEELAARVLDVVGVRAPAVARLDFHTLAMEFVDGKQGGPSGVLSAPAAVRNTDEGRLLGLADALMGNRDRNQGNWMRTPDGHLVAIDHGGAFLTSEEAAAGNPFASYLLGSDSWTRENDLDPAALASLRAELESLKPDFDRLGRRVWYDRMIARLDEIQRRANGRQLAGAWPVMRVDTPTKPAPARKAVPKADGGQGPPQLAAHLDTINNVPETAGRGARASVAEALTRQAELAPRSMSVLQGVSLRPGASLFGTADVQHSDAKFNPASFTIDLNSQVAEGGFAQTQAKQRLHGVFVPGGPDEIQNLLGHEIGHHIATIIQPRPGRWLPGSRDRLFVPLAHELGVKPPQSETDINDWLDRPDVQAAIKAHLSDYAAKNQLELVAEVWGEYSTRGIRARPLARHIGPIMAQMAEGTFAPPPPDGPGTSDLAAAVAQHEPQVVRTFGNGAGAVTELVQLGDRRAVRKTLSENTYAPIPALQQAHAETLAASLARAVGLPGTPAVHQSGDGEVFMDYREGVHASDSPFLAAQQTGSEQGKRMALLDAIMANTDRHGENWLIGDDGNLVPIDHAAAFEFPADPTAPHYRNETDAFAHHLFTGGIPGRWRDGVDYSRAELSDLRASVAALRDEFAASGRIDWYEAVLARIDHIATLARNP